MRRHFSLTAFRSFAIPLLFILGWNSNLKAGPTKIDFDQNGNTLSQQSATATAPTISGQLGALNAAATGEPASFSINIDSTLPVTYQWYFNGTLISGATRDTLLLNNLTFANEGLYTVTVTNSLGSVTSNPSRMVIDENGNGLGDDWELQYFGNLDQNPNADPDGDQLTNVEELINGTNPIERTPYYWTAASGDFDNPANWNWKRVPGLGDIAFINSGTFTINGAGAAPKVNLTVNQPYYFSTAADTTLALKGTWTLNGPVTLPSGHTLRVTSGNLNVNGSIALDGTNITAQGINTKVNINSLVTYTQPNNIGMTWRAGEANQNNTGCELNFPNLTTIVGGVTTTSSDRYFYLIGRAGGTLNLPALTSITVPQETSSGDSGVQMNADGGLLSAPVLTQFTDATPLGNSWLQSYSGGTLSVPMLTDPVGIQINVTSTFNLAQFRSLAGTRYLRLIAGTSSVMLSNINHIREIYAINSAKLTFPNVTSYTQPNNASVTWRAGEASKNNTGCELNFPNLTTIIGGITTTSSSRYFDIVARTGGTLNLPFLSSISVPKETANGSSGTRIYSLDGGVFNAARLVSFIDLSDPFASRIEASATSVYRFTSLRQEGLQGVILSGVTLLTGPVNLQPPTISSAASAAGIAGSAFSYQITGTNMPASFSAAPLPADLTVNTTTGLISGTPAFPGIFNIQITVINPDGIGSAQLTLVIAAPTFAQYLENAGVPVEMRGPLDDHDKDGNPNLLEYALGMNPMGADVQGLPTIQMSEGNITYSYSKRRSDVTYVVETSTSLEGGWTSNGVNQGVPDNQNAVIASTPASGGKRFLRLKVHLTQ